MTCPNVRAALELLAAEGVLLPDEHPEHAEALRLAHRFGLVRRPPGRCLAERYRMTPRGERWLRSWWPLESARDVAERRRQTVRDEVEAAARDGRAFDVSEVVRDLGVTVRRVNQIRAALAHGGCDE